MSDRSEIAERAAAPAAGPQPVAGVRAAAGGRLGALMRARPARPGETYGVPGQGDSLLISAVSALVLFALWSLITGLGWVKPLFLPSPLAVLNTFVTTATDGFAGGTLFEHTLGQFPPRLRRLPAGHAPSASRSGSRWE